MLKIAMSILFTFIFFTSCESPYMVRHPVSKGDTYHLYATYYGDEFEGRQSADGSTFSQNELTCAARGFPFGTMLEVKSVSTKKRVVVKVTDRPGKNVIDLSKKAFGEIDDLSKGKIRVKIKVVDRDFVPAGTNDDTASPPQPEDQIVETDRLYTVQVYSFGNIEDAKKAESELDLDCHIFVKKGNFFVRCGSFSTKEEAEQFKKDNLSDNNDAAVIEISE